MIGPVGVFVFFVISGFILPYAMNKSQYQFSHFWLYLLKRIKRLYPPYFVLFILTTGMLIWNNFYQNIPFTFKTGEFISHLFYLTHILHFDWYNPIFWTLAIEFQYYIFLGVIFKFWNSSSWIQRFFATVPFLILSWYWRDDRFLFHYIAPFIMGYGTYLIKFKKANLVEPIFYISLASLVIWKYFGWHWLIASVGSVIVILFLTLNYRPLQQLGKISYSLYLVHAMFGGLAVYLLMPFFDSTVGNYFTLALGISFSILVSEVYYRWIEKPSIKWADTLTK